MASADSSRIPEKLEQFVRAVLLSKIDGVLLSKFARDYRNLLEEPVPYRKCGFSTLEAFLRALPNTVRFEYSKINCDWRLYGIGAPNTYMSAPIKQAQGKPGHDVDKLDEKRRRGHGGGRHRTQQGKSYRERNVDSSAEPMLMASCNGLYSLCCPLFTNGEEEIINAFKTVANVVGTSMSKRYLFTRYKNKADALRVLAKFGDKFSVQPALEKMSGSGGNNNRRGTSPPSSSQGLGTKASNAPKEKRVSKLRDEVEIYIGNIPTNFTESTLLSLLKGLPVNGIRIKVKDENKRFAFGSLSREDALEAVDRLNDKMIENRRLICRLANPDPARVAQGKSMAQTDINTVTTLVKMGFPVEGVRRAVYFSGDKGVGDAIAWIKQHQDDDDFKKPFTIPKTSESSSKTSFSNAGSGFKVNPSALAMIMSQGLTHGQATRVLEATNNNLRSAEAWIIEHIEELTSRQEPTMSCEGDAASHASKNLGTQAGATVDGRGPASTKKPGGEDDIVAGRSSTSSSFQPDPEALKTLSSLGLPEEKIVEALKATNNDLQEAAQWIIYNTDDLKKALDNLEPTDTETTASESGREFSKTDIPAVQNKPVENDGHVSSVTQNGLPIKPGQDAANNNNDGDDDDDDADLPPLEEVDDDDDMPDLEYMYDSDDYVKSTADTDTLSTDSGGQKVSIYVGHFPSGTTQVQLLETFAEYQPSKITLVNNIEGPRKTFAFLVLPNAEIAEQAISDMSGECSFGAPITVGMAFLNKGYHEPSDDEEDAEEPDANGESEFPDSPGKMPDSVEMFDNLMAVLWPDCRLIQNGLFGMLRVSVTHVVDEQFFYGHVLDFTGEMIMLTKLNEELNYVCSRRAPEKKLPRYRCAALYDGNWYRAYNMGDMGSDQQAVLFVDFGNIDTVGVKDLRRPDMSRFWEIPAVAKPFKLTVGSLKDYNDIEEKILTIGTVPRNEGETWNAVSKCKILSAE